MSSADDIILRIEAQLLAQGIALDPCAFCFGRGERYVRNDTYSCRPCLSTGLAAFYVPGAKECAERRNHR